MELRVGRPRRRDGFATGVSPDRSVLCFIWRHWQVLQIARLQVDDRDHVLDGPEPSRAGLHALDRRGIPSLGPIVRRNYSGHSKPIFQAIRRCPPLKRTRCVALMQQSENILCGSRYSVLKSIPDRLSGNPEFDCRHIPRTVPRPRLRNCRTPRSVPER